MRVIYLRLTLRWLVLQRQAMLMYHLGDADVHQITPVLVNWAKHKPERGPPGAVPVSRCIPSTAMSPAMNLPVSLEQTTGEDQDSGQDSCPKNTSPRRCSAAPPGIGLNTGVTEKDYFPCELQQ